jgi:carbamoyltransferase
MPVAPFSMPEIMVSLVRCLDFHKKEKIADAIHAAIEQIHGFSPLSERKRILLIDKNEDKSDIHTIFMQCLKEYLLDNSCEIISGISIDDTDRYDAIINIKNLEQSRLKWSSILRNLFPEIPAQGLLDSYLNLKKPVLNIAHAFATSEDSYSFMALSSDAIALDVVLIAICGFSDALDEILQAAKHKGLKSAFLENISLLGVPLEANRRPCPAVPRTKENNWNGYVTLFKDRCNACGICEKVCPSSAISMNKKYPVFRENACIGCYCCVEFCEGDALAPLVSTDRPVGCRSLKGLSGFLSKLSAADCYKGSSAGPPEYLIPHAKPEKKSKPLVILGLACTTQQENTAALLIDGHIKGAVEEERINRSKHYGYRPKQERGLTLCNDPSIKVEHSFPWKGINALLEMEGLTFKDVDYIALNGIPMRYMYSYSLSDPKKPPRLLKSNNLFFVPHHLCHAASAYYFSGFRDALIFTVDGRGERETAAFFEGSENQIIWKKDLLVHTDSSIGGIYETISMILGFGAFGQGSTMALSVMGEDKFDFQNVLTVKKFDDYIIHELEAFQKFQRFQRSRNEEIGADHRDLAASLQAALERSIENLLKDAGGKKNWKDINLCLAGGVALNCQMNYKIREMFKQKDIFVIPAAHDSGTAIGAALVAYNYLTGKQEEKRLGHACLGLSYSDEQIEKILRKFSIPFRKSSDIAEETASLIASGKIVCWFQGRVEIGPRALGNRSILADPRNASVKERLNKMKGRQSWRPFGPSILKGREHEYFEGAFESPFMLFTFPVKKEKREIVPAIVHYDGTTRPQSVSRDHNRLYHGLLENIDKITGIPLVLNTSFNMGQEPIVCSPEDAVQSFIMMGADYLAAGNFLVSMEEIDRNISAAEQKKDTAAFPYAVKKETRSGKKKSNLPENFKNGRFFLRLTRKCNNNCLHCSILDLPDMNDRYTESAEDEIKKAYESGCREIVFMRGDVLIRKDLLKLVRIAKNLGYRIIQIQSNGRALCYEKYADMLIESGVSDFEISIYGHDRILHDYVSRMAGSFEQTFKGIKIIAGKGAHLLVNVPVITQNMTKLVDMVDILDSAGVKRVQFNFPRPLRIGKTWMLHYIPRISIASHYVREAMKEASSRRMDVSTEAIPLCHLQKEFHSFPDRNEDFSRFRICDLHLTHDSFGEYRKEARKPGKECADCIHLKKCPFTWASYIELFGTKEFLTVYE